MIDNIKKKEE